MGKAEIARNEQILFSHSVFYHFFFFFFLRGGGDFLPFSSNSKLSSANSFGSEESIILSFGKASKTVRTAMTVLTLYHKTKSTRITS